MIKRKIGNFIRQRAAFSLLELAIVMAVAGLLFGGLFQILGNSNAQITAQNVAQQQQNMIRAVRAYIINNFNTIATLNSAGAAPKAYALDALMRAVNGTASPANMAAAIRSIVPLLSSSTITPSNPYQQPYYVYVSVPQGQTAGSTTAYVSFMITAANAVNSVPVTNPPHDSVNIPDSTGGLIASLIGSDGGFFYSHPNISGTGLCTTPGSYLSAFAGLCLTPANFNALYSAAANFGPGHVASISYVTTSDLGNELSQFLDRLKTGTPLVNTMQAELQFATATSSYLTAPDTPAGNPSIAMGSNPIYMYTANTLASGAVGSATAGGNLLMQGGNIFMGGGDLASAPTAAAATPVGTLYMNSGNIDMTAGGQIAFGTGQDSQGNSTACNMRMSSATGAIVTNNCSMSLTGGSSASSGAFTAGLGTFTISLSSVEFDYSSDRRLKKDVEPLPNHMLEKLLALQPVSFRWKSNDKKEIGLIAQDVQQQFPDLVSTDPKTGYMSVEMGNLVSPIIQSLHELEQENRELKAELAKQQQEIEQLKHP